MSKPGKGINFYDAYRESRRVKRPAARWLVAVIPLILIFAVIGGVAMYIRFENLQKTAALDSVHRGIEQLGGDYADVQALSDESAALAVLADELQTDSELAALLPVLDENLFTQVNACAAGVFSISVYRYDEATRTLEIDASAPSVNDMPELVEALRDTALFSSVQYVGYTSDTDGVYYCTVGCVLAGQGGEG